VLLKKIIENQKIISKPFLSLPEGQRATPLPHSSLSRHGRRGKRQKKRGPVLGGFLVASKQRNQSG